jgi:hypothetical protein
MPASTASGVTWSSASRMSSALWRAITQARTTPISVSLARAYATGGIAQIASERQPGSAAITFMNTLAATAATFSTRARNARLPCSASAIPSEANTRAAASGIAASRPATSASRRAAKII